MKTGSGSGFGSDINACTCWFLLEVTDIIRIICYDIKLAGTGDSLTIFFYRATQPIPDVLCMINRLSI